VNSATEFLSIDTGAKSIKFNFKACKFDVLQ
jgi:hypothetical protein